MTEKDFNNCVDLHADNIYRFIYKNLKDADTSKDVVQNTYEILWKKHGEISMEKAKSYLFTVAYHNMIDLVRKQKRVIKMEDYHEDLQIASIEEYTGIREMLEKGLDKLPEQQKSVILLRDYEGYSYNEIADITGLTLEQVKVYIFRARKFLKEHVQKMEGRYAYQHR